MTDILMGTRRSIHKVADLFPMMQPDEYSELKADIQTNGLLEPIWTYQDEIIDGRNRYKACLEIGITPDFREWSGDGSLTAFVVSLNLKRRHLTSSMKAMIAVEVAALFEVEAKERQREAGGDRGNQYTGGKFQEVAVPPILGEPPLLEANSGSVPKAEDPEAQEIKTRNESARQSAQVVGVSHSYISDAKKLKKQNPELADRVAKGQITIPEAKQVAAQPQAKQQEIIQSVEQGVTVKEAVATVNRQARIENINQIANGNKPLVASPLAELEDWEAEDTSEAIQRLYPVIYADPPWRYEHVKTDSRAIENQYPTMTLDEICDLPVGDIATPDAILFLWTTAPKAEEAMRVINSWGFTYRTQAIWDKEKIGMGYYFRIQHELLYIATRGSIPTPQPSDRVSSVIRDSRTEHSKKPDIFYEIIERMYPEFPRIELFCRSPRYGWDVWGNQSNA